MFQMKTLLLPVVFSERSLEAARQAKALAERFHSRLIVLNILEQDRRTELQFEAGGSSVQELQTYLNRQFRDEEIDYVVRSGDPVEVINRTAHASGADLIVMSGHSYRPFESFALGSVTAELLASASCPVWVSLHCEKGPPPLFRRVLCSLSLDDPREASMKWALRFADAFHAHCDVIHVSRDGSEPCGWDPSGSALSRAESEEVEHVRSRLGNRGDLLLAKGELPAVVDDAARDMKSDLLVIGRSRAGNEINHVHSPSYRLVHQAPCPVVSVVASNCETPTSATNEVAAVN